MAHQIRGHHHIIAGIPQDNRPHYSNYGTIYPSLASVTISRDNSHSFMRTRRGIRSLCGVVITVSLILFFFGVLTLAGVFGKTLKGSLSGDATLAGASLTGFGAVFLVGCLMFVIPLRCLGTQQHNASHQEQAVGRISYAASGQQVFDPSYHQEYQTAHLYQPPPPYSFIQTQSDQVLASNSRPSGEFAEFQVPDLRKAEESNLDLASTSHNEKEADTSPLINKDNP